MTTLNRDQFFARQGVQPCRDCLRYDAPGQGIGPIIGEILLGCYQRAEIDRLERLAARGAISDACNERMKAENNAMFVRACWLIGYQPGNFDQGDLFAQTA